MKIEIKLDSLGRNTNKAEILLELAEMIKESSFKELGAASNRWSGDHSAVVIEVTEE